MRTDPGALVSSALRAWCAGAAVLAVLTGAGALAGGWQLETGAAVCFVLCGAALWTPRWPLSVRGGRVAADLAAGLAALVALLAIGQRVAGVDSSGPMSLLTALCFLMIGAALLSLDRAPVFATGQRLAVAAGFIAFLGNLQLLAAKIGERPELQRHFEHGERAVRRIAVMIDHMTRITRLEPLAGLDTGG
ncbi:MAG: hypothetical protein ACREKJ_01105, partial [Candidatus Rokuibacteriota bacterium]